MSFLERNKVILTLALIKFTLPFLLQHPVYELHRDEYLYLAQGHHLDWGFMEVPPLLSLLAKFTHIAGSGFFWVKFWPALFGALTLLLVCKMVSEMGGKIYAQCLAGLCMITGAYLRVHFLFQPNFLEIFWWTLGAWLIIKYINTEKAVFIYGLGMAIGIGWMSKYSVLFFVTGVMGGLLLTSNRKILLKKHIYLAALLAFMIALPNLVWQFNHRWPVLHHMQELRETQLQYVRPADFLKDQLLMHLPCFFVWLGGLYWLLFLQPGRSYRLLAFIYLGVICLLILTSGKNYYSLGAYPMLFSAGAVWIEQFTAVRMKWARYVTIAVILILFIPPIPLLLPVWEPVKLASYYKRSGLDKTGALKWEDLKDHPLPQDFADMLCWKEMFEKASFVYSGLADSVKTKTLVYCRNYGQAGALTYFSKNALPVTSDNASFLLWIPGIPDVKHILFVGESLPDRDDVVFQQFENYQIIDSITNPLAREYGTKIILFKNGNEKVNGLIQSALAKMKADFRR